MIRQTKQQKTVLNQVQKMHSHPTADEVFNALKKDNVDISLATVYRHLTSLSTTGHIKRIQKSGSADRFDRRTDIHQHFICDSCGALFDVDMKVNLDISMIPFVVNSYDITIHGTCPKC